MARNVRSWLGTALVVLENVLGGLFEVVWETLTDPEQFWSDG